MKPLPLGWLATICLAASSAIAEPPRLQPEPTARPMSEAQPIDVLAALRPQPGGMTAEEAARRAVQRAPTVASARNVIEQARARAASAKLELIPRLDLSASYRRLSNIDLPPFEFGGTTFDNPFPVLLNHYDLEATVAVPVSDIVLSRLPSYRSARALVDVARYQAEAEQQDIAFRARHTFFSVAQAKAAELVTQDSVRLLAANVDDIEALARAGVVTGADVERARAQLAGARVRLAKVRASLTVALASYLQAVAGGEPISTAIGEDLLQLPKRCILPAAQLLQQAWQRRPEMQALREIVRARQHAVAASRAPMLPRLDLTGNLQFARPNPRVIPPEDEFRGAWSAGAVLSWSPNDLFVGNQAVNRAEHELDQARNDLRALRDGIAIEVARARANYRAATEAITAANEALRAAQSSYASRRDLLRAGEATTSEFLEAETELRRAQLDVVDAYADVRKALAEVDKAIGRAAPGPV